MTKAQALSILSDIVEAHTGTFNGMNPEERAEAQQAELALKTIAQDWHVPLCPLCDVRLEHIEVNGTHIYKCEPCPFIGLEFYNDNDIINLKASIK